MRKSLRCSIYLFLFFLIRFSSGFSQVLLTNGSPLYSQDFDAMTVTINLPANWRMGASTGSPTWASASAFLTQQASSGSPTAGGTYNWGAGVADRAIGSMTSAAFAGPNSPLCYFSNAGTSTITDLAISYSAERYRINTAAASIQFYYSLDGSTWISVPPGDIAASSFPTGASSYSFTPPSPIINVTGITITALTISPGSDFYLRWNINTTGTSSQGIGIDDVALAATFAPVNTITTGTVSAPPFLLVDCITPGAGTVAFSSTDVFGPGNTFTAQLSDDIGSFVTPVFLGSIPLDGTAPAAVIPIVIPAGTVSGTGYKIRVISNTPAVTGSSSASFQIIQPGACASSHTDFYRSKQSGNWGLLSTWETSQDNSVWINATLLPTVNANRIYIRNGHTVTLTASETMDQVEIQSGGILENNMPASNILTIADGAGDDMDIKPGGIYLVSSSQSYTNNFAINSGAVVHIETTGIIKIGTGGTVGGSNNNYAIISASFVWDDGSIFQWNTTTIPGIQATFFPDAVAAVIPVFQFTATPSLSMGGGSATVVKGRLEATSVITFTGAGTKTFRNGIRASANIDGTGSGKFMINGANAELGGTGTLILPTSGGMEIGSPGTVTMSSDKVVTGNIALLPSNSLIVLGNFNLTVSGSVSITSPDLTSFVKTNGTGKLKLIAVGPAGRLFIVGNSTINPLYIQSGTTSNYSVRIVEPVTPPIFDVNRAVNRTWYIVSSASNPNATISFGYSYPGDCGASYNNSGPVEVAVNVGGVWNILQSGLTPVAFPLVLGTYVVTPGTAINTFNGSATEFPFAIANNGAILPLDYFISARAEKRNNSGVVSWKIFSTDDIVDFDLERSVNHGAFTSIGRINPAIGQLDYSFADISPGAGTNLYRVKVNRRSGAERYSNTVALIYGAGGLLITSVTPNPVRNSVTITLSAAVRDRANMDLIDVTGKRWMHWLSDISDGNNLIPVNLSMLPAGVYFILASTTRARAVFRIVKQ